jgi:hypothetical protein
MNTIYNIKYIDAHYGYGQYSADVSTLPIQEAYGYVHIGKNDIIVQFIKKKSTAKEFNPIKNKDTIVKGLIIPKVLTLPFVKSFDPKEELFAVLEIGKKTEATWRDVTYVANTKRYDSAVMRSRGVLVDIHKDHLVLTQPETMRIYPKPEINHPEKPAAFCRIPLPALTDIKQPK